MTKTVKQQHETTYSLLRKITFLAFLALSCESQPDTSSHPFVAPTEDHMSELTQLHSIRAISVYDRPQGQQIAQIQAGNNLALGGIISDRLYTHFVDQDTLNLPYLQISQGPHQSGWILAQAALYEGKNSTWQQEQCLRALLPEEKFRNYQHLLNTWKNSKQAALLLLAFQLEHELTVDLSIALRPYTSLASSNFKHLFPATILYRKNESLSWWIDYNQWVERAAGTPEAYDDALFQYYQQSIYPPDGISYNFPAWTFPVSATEDHSLLGRGHYLANLNQLSELSKTHPEIDYKWNQLIEELLLDLLRPQRTFWEEKSAISKELSAIRQLTIPLIQHTHREVLELLDEKLATSPEQIGFRAK